MNLFQCTALTTQNTKKNSIISHSQNTTALEPKVLLSGIPRFLVTNKGRSAFPSANHWQGKLQSP